MPFPFFGLPFELRYMIYQDCFTPADKHQPIAPDVTHLRREEDVGRPSTQTTITLKCPALSFIRTCQQAHEEGTNVLYGDNTFRFGDSPYHQKQSSYSYGSVFTPFCEIFYMYPFLSVIGKANQLKIRHLELRFYIESFITFPEYRDLWNTNTSNDNGRASYINDALNFFSESHRLQSLDLYFYGRYNGMAEFSIWFSKDSRLFRTLAQFKAIEKLRCRVENPPSNYHLNNAKCVVYKQAVDNYQELKVKLAAAYRLRRGQIDSSSAKNGFKSDPLSQFGTSS